MIRVENVSMGSGVSWRSSAIVFALAWVLRTYVALRWPNLHHPDELFQSLEQAHRLVFDTGLVPWEFRDGARSWLLPGLLGAAMWLGEAIAPATEAYRYAAVGLVAAVSASTAVVAWHWGRRQGMGAAVVCVVAVSTWFELVYFGAKAFGEVVGAAFLFAGVYACSRDAESARRGSWLAGALLGCAVAFRFHLAPAAAVAAAWYCRPDWRARAWPLCVGGLVPLALLGLVDWATWGMPFASVLRNFATNIFEGRSHHYGVSGAAWYAQELWRHWGWALPVLVGLAMIGARREPLPLVVALLIVLAHSAIAHKEYRFIVPALAPFIFVAALGSARLLSHATSWTVAHARPASLAGPRTIPFVLLVLAWLGMSATLAGSAAMEPEWTRARAGLELLRQARRDARCGIALQGVVWAWSGGYSWWHAPWPIHELPPGRVSRRASLAFDAWLAPAGDDAPRRHGFALRRCETQRDGYVESACLWTRPSSTCQPELGSPVQGGMEARGE